MTKKEHEEQEKSESKSEDVKKPADSEPTRDWESSGMNFGVPKTDSKWDDPNEPHIEPRKKEDGD